MTKKTCKNCKAQVEELNLQCQACGFTIVLEPDEAHRARALRMPSLGALLFTQGWTFGARLYLLFAVSLIPIVGIVILVIGVVFGRRLSWKYGGWASFEEFQTRMRLMDGIGIVWVILLTAVYFYVRN